MSDRTLFHLFLLEHCSIFDCTNRPSSIILPPAGVASLGAPKPGNPGNRGMEATLGLRASPAACRTGGQLSSTKSIGTQVQLGLRRCFNFSVCDSRSAVLCEYTIWLDWFLAVCTVCTQYTLIAQAKLVLYSALHTVRSTLKLVHPL